MMNNHERNKRKHDNNSIRRNNRQTEGMENGWEAEPAWPVLVEANGEVLGAQGGVFNTADEGTAAPVEGEVTAALPSRKIRRPRTRKRGGAAESPTDADADNQGLPGSVMATDTVEIGQGLQETADAFREDPRVKGLQKDHRLQLAALEEDNATKDGAAKILKADLKKFENKLWDCQTALRKETQAHSIADKFTGALEFDLAKEKTAFQKYRDEHDETINATPALAAALAEAKKTITDLFSELKDAAAAKIPVVTERDDLLAEIANLRTANELLEAEVATSKDLIANSAINTTCLDGEIARVHAEFEYAFSDMAKDLTMDQKFAYVREQQQKSALATRLASESTLHDELEAATPEALSFSKITSVETVPVVAVPAVVAKKPFGFSAISSVDTKPVALPAAAATAAAAKKPMSFFFSGVTSVETAPIAAPAAAPLITKKKPMTFSGTTSVETKPVAAAPAAVNEKPKVITKIIEVHIPYDRFLDRAVVPWWMWLLFLLGLLMCFGGFAGLWREQQIWIAANDTAYQRLMGVKQETWFEWTIMGVKALVPSI